MSDEELDFRKLMVKRGTRAFEWESAVDPETAKKMEGIDMKFQMAGLQGPSPQIIIQVSCSAKKAIEQMRKFGEAMQRLAVAAAHQRLAALCTCPKAHPARERIDWNQHPRRCEYRKQEEILYRRACRRDRGRLSQMDHIERRLF